MAQLGDEVEFWARVCQVDPCMPLMEYCNAEWKGSTASATQIREGYKRLSRERRGAAIRRVRGDNYCALRAPLFQLIKFPEVFKEIFHKLTATQDMLQTHPEFARFQRLWRAHRGLTIDVIFREAPRLFVATTNVRISDDVVMLEAIKLLMLGEVVKFFEKFRANEPVPEWVTLCFSRDDSHDPLSFLTNRLQRVGDTAGLDMVDMSLLAHTLGVTIVDYRLRSVRSDFFATFPYGGFATPRPEVIVISEDDRHYNVLCTHHNHQAFRVDALLGPDLAVAAIKRTLQVSVCAGLDAWAAWTVVESARHGLGSLRPAGWAGIRRVHDVGMLLQRAALRAVLFGSLAAAATGDGVGLRLADRATQLKEILMSPHSLELVSMCDSRLPVPGELSCLDSIDALLFVWRFLHERKDPALPFALLGAQSTDVLEQHMLIALQALMVALTASGENIDALLVHGTRDVLLGRIYSSTLELSELCGVLSRTLPLSVVLHLMPKAVPQEFEGATRSVARVGLVVSQPAWYGDTDVFVGVLCRGCEGCHKFRGA